MSNSIKNLSGHPYTFITTTLGRKLLMLNGYTFYLKNPLQYYCSKSMRSKCKAQVKLDKMGLILKVREDHNHEPPTYRITQRGEYLKIDS